MAPCMLPGLHGGPRLLLALAARSRVTSALLLAAPPARALRGHSPTSPVSRRGLSSAHHSRIDPRVAASGSSSATDSMADAAAAAAKAADATGSTPPPRLASTLPDELKAQFCQRLDLTAIRVPKQRTSQYMKLLSK